MELKNFQSFVDQVSKEETDQYYFTIKYYEKKGWPIKIPPAILIKAAELYAEYKAEEVRKKHKEVCEKRKFFIDEISDQVKAVTNKKMSISKFVELLNEKATGVSWEVMVRREAAEREAEKNNDK